MSFQTKIDRGCPAVKNGWLCSGCGFEITSNNYVLIVDGESLAVPIHQCCYVPQRDQLAGVRHPVRPDLVSPNDPTPQILRAIVAAMILDKDCVCTN